MLPGWVWSRIRNPGQKWYRVHDEDGCAQVQNIHTEIDVSGNSSTLLLTETKYIDQITSMQIQNKRSN